MGRCVEIEPFVFRVNTFNENTEDKPHVVRWTTDDRTLSNLRIDCGENGYASNPGALECTFTKRATHTVSIYGAFDNIYMCDNNSGSDASATLLSVDQWGGNPWKSLRGMFQKCKNTRILATDIPDFRSVTDAEYMFAQSGNIQVQGIMWDNTLQDISFAHMFEDATGTISGLSNWNTSHVVNMEYMFQNARTFNAPIGNWDVRRVKSMALMFGRAEKFNQFIGNWKLDSLEDTTLMFYDADDFDQSISNWRMPNLIQANQMFTYSYYNEVIDGWDLRQVKSYYDMFQSVMCYKLQNMIFPAGKTKRDFGCL